MKILDENNNEVEMDEMSLTEIVHIYNKFMHKSLNDIKSEVQDIKAQNVKILANCEDIVSGTE